MVTLIRCSKGSTRISFRYEFVLLRVLSVYQSVIVV